MCRQHQRVAGKQRGSLTKDIDRAMTASDVPAPTGTQAETEAVDGRAISGAALRVATWQDENHDATEAHARYVEEQGLPLGTHRMF